MAHFQSAAQTTYLSGFEDGLDTWQANPAASGTSDAVTRDNLHARTGTYSLKCTTTSTSPSTTTNAYYSPLEYIAGSTANPYVHVIFWVYGTVAQKYKAGIGKNTGAPTTSTVWAGSTQSSSFATSANIWTQFNFVSSSASTSTYFYGSVNKSTTGGASPFWLDDAIFYSDNVATTDTTEPGAVATLGTPVASADTATLTWTNGTDAGTGLQATYVLRATSNAYKPVLHDQGIYQAIYGATGAFGPTTDSTGLWTIIDSVASGTLTYKDTSTKATGTYYYAIMQRDKAYNYSNIFTTLSTANIKSIALSNGAAAPTLTATTPTRTVDSSFTVTFPTSIAYTDSISSITLGVTTLTPTTDYTISNNNTITFTPTSGGAAALHTPGTYTITVLARNYQNATVSQTLTVGAASKLAINTQPLTTANGVPLTTQPVVKIQDQFGNATTSTLSVTAANDASSNGTWTLSGTTSVTAVNGTATFTNLVASSTANVTSAVIAFSASTFTNVLSAGFNIPAPSPIVTTSGTLTSFGSVGAGAISAEQTYQVSAANLTGNLTVTPPADFEVSLTTGSGFVGSTSNLSITPTSGSVPATTIYVHYAPAAATGASGSQNIANASASATTQNIVVSGNATAAQPTAVGTLTFGTINNTSMVLNYAPATSGGGTNRIIVAYAGAAPGYVPADGAAVSGTVSAVYTTATNQTGNGHIVFNGTTSGNSVVTVTGLTQNTQYYFAVYEYNGTTGTLENYYATPATANATTTGPVITDTLPTTSTNSILGWSGGTGTGNFGTFAPPGNGTTKKFMIGGTLLTASISVNVPLGFKISTAVPGTSGFSVGPVSKTYSQTGGTIPAGSDTVYIHPDGTIASGTAGPGYGPYTANITLTSTGATTVTIPVSDTILSLIPTASGTLTFGTATNTTIPVNYATATGVGTNRIIVARAGGSVTYTPVNGLPATGVNSVFSSATDQGSGNKVVYDGTTTGSNVVTVTGLTPGTTYYFKVFEYNVGNPNSQDYYIAAPATGNTTTTFSITDYYSASTGNLDATTTWGTATDGTGSNPTDFVTIGQVFHISNSNSGAISGASWTVSGTSSKIAVDNGTDLTISSSHYIVGTIDVGAGRTLTINNTTAPTLGVLNATATVIYGASSNTIPSSQTTFPNLEVSNSTTISANTTVNGTLMMNGGKLNLNGHKLIINDISGASGSSSITGSSTSGLVINSNLSGSVYFDQTSTATATLDTLVVNGNATLGNMLNMAAGTSPGNVTVGTGATLTTGGNLTLLSDINGTARIAALSGTVSGAVNIQRYIPAQRGYRLIGHPYTAGNEPTIATLGNYFDVTGLSGGNIGPAATHCPSTNPSTYTYTPGTSPAYVGITSSSTAIPAAQSSGSVANGILAFVRGGTGDVGCVSNTSYTVTPTTMVTGAPINQGSKTETVLAGGYNIISNPYPSQIQISSISNYNATGISFITVNPGGQNLGNNYVNGTSYGTADGTTIIPINGAVLAYNASGSDVALGFTESTKTAGTPTSGLLKATNIYPSVELSVYYGNTFWDSWSMMMQPGTRNAAGDIGDVPKISNTQMDLYSLSKDTKSLYRDARDADSITDGEIVTLGLRSVPQATYTIQVSQYNLPSDKTVYLHDKYTNSYVLVGNGVNYPLTVNSDANSQGQNRLELIFNENNSNTGIGNIANRTAGILIVPNPATSNINVSYSNEFAGSKIIRIVNVVGQVVKEISTADQAITIPVDNMANGMYLIKTIVNGKSITERFIKN
ncbi:MAG: T9SS type A sorting domain-containing protein [Flavipsychrobacter sp.]|nr:T9SS type A sorting domain-containing protein [Flavipsychrobacter sp.]